MLIKGSCKIARAFFFPEKFYLSFLHNRINKRLIQKDVDKMLVVNGLEGIMSNTVLGYLPKRIRKYMYFADWDELEEIRLRLGLPVMLQYRDAVLCLNDKGGGVIRGENLVCPTSSDMAEALELISHSSFYAHEQDIKNGFITIEGGNRVGLTGSGVIVGGEISSIKDISGLNYRIAHEVSGCSDRLIDMIVADKRVKNTLIISPPGCGKTTLLRDIIRNISRLNRKVSVVDERGEITASFGGIRGFELGNNCDILTGVPKDQGMILMLRSMSPNVIATDELGGDGEISAVEKIVNSGVSVVATIHGASPEQLKNRENIKKLMGYFECFIVLSRRFGVGTIEEAYCVD